MGSIVVILLGAYTILGILFAVVFVLRGVTAVDPRAKGGSLGFRIAIFPGSVLFWPLMLKRWVKGPHTPPPGYDMHRLMANGACGLDCAVCDKECHL